MSISRGSLCAALAAVMFLSTGAAARDDAAAKPVRPLSLRSGDVLPARAERNLAELATPEARAKRKLRAIIRVDGPLTDPQRAALEDAGLRPGEFLPPDAYIVDATRLDKAKAAALDFVRRADEFRPEWKLDPDIGLRAYSTGPREELARSGRVLVDIHLFDSEPEAPALAQVRAIGGSRVVKVARAAGTTTITASLRFADAVLLSDIPEVAFVEDAPENTPRSNSATRWIVQSNTQGVVPLYTNGLRGEGQILGILDGNPVTNQGLDINHCSFRDSVNNTPGPGHRKVLAINGGVPANTHGTHVAATAAGDAGVSDDTRGIASGAKLVFGLYPNPQNETNIADKLALHYAQGARIHTNSWGDDSTTAYTGQCRSIDAHSYQNEDSLVLFACTNSSTLKTPENAKNCLAVAASGGNGLQDTFCSGGSGPTIDGRRKPEVYAPGCLTASADDLTTCGTTQLTGTSMATPAVAGVAALVRQYFMEGMYPSGARVSTDAFTPSAALLKAMIINSAVDMTGIAGFPGNQEGWGRVLADNAVRFPGDARQLIVRDTRNAVGLTTDQEWDIGVSVAPDQPLKVTLVWTDPPAPVNSTATLINDLDLQVFGPGNVVYRGNEFAGGQSVAGSVKDRVNNVEQVLLSTPASGAYVVRVKAAAVNQGTQGFALVITGGVAQTAKPLTIDIPQAPTTLAPATPTSFTVELHPGDEGVLDGSPRLAFALGSSDFATIPLTKLSDTRYLATLPPMFCGESPRYYVQAQGLQTGRATSPAPGASTPISAVVGVFETSFADSFEIDSGWTVGATGDTATGGVWTRVDPIGTSAQPEDDATASGALCFVTGQHTPGQSTGFNDVDGGATTLLSPIINLAATPTATISYWRWFAGSSIDDTLTVSISNNAGSTWTTVEQVAGGPGGWMSKTFSPASFVTPITSQMRLRFVAADAGVGTICEAAIDDVTIGSVVCSGATVCGGDANFDRTVNFDDLTAVLSTFGTAGLIGDADRNGVSNFDDLTAVLASFGNRCP